MCLITLQKEPLEAEEDIIVYKEVFKQTEENIYESIYNAFIWEPNKLYKTDLKKNSKDTGLIYYDEKSMKHYSSTSKDLLTSISEGFHSMDRNRAKNRAKDKDKKIISLREKYGSTFNEKYGSNHVFIECKIPKASLYYKDETGLYVSNQLIVLKEVKLRDLT